VPVAPLSSSGRERWKKAEPIKFARVSPINRKEGKDKLDILLKFPYL
jgi:hypothetical protein